VQEHNVWTIGVVGSCFSPDTYFVPKTPRDYLHASLVVTAVALLIAGAVLFRAAVAFEAYISALLVLALAGVSFLCAVELKRKKIDRRQSEDRQPEIEPL
jgi:hypothetical protein